MTAAALLAAALAAAALPQGTARYRMELGGTAVGAAELAVSCAGARCFAGWSTRLVLPAESGGGLLEKRVEVDVDLAGRTIGGASRGLRDGVAVRVPAPAGLVPAMIAPLVLARQRAPGCLPAWDEETGARGEACRGEGAGRITVLGVEMAVTPGADGLPEVVEIPSQRARFTRDAAAQAPLQVTLSLARVEGPPEAQTFCGRERQPDEDGPPPRGLPPPAGRGESCSRIATDWLLAAAQARIPGVLVVGVVLAPQGWTWHTWAEVPGAHGRPFPVDPAFGEAPARSPRFAVARYGVADPAGRVEAGKRVLACLGERAR